MAETLGLIGYESAPILGVNGKLDDQAPIADIYIAYGARITERGSDIPRWPAHGVEAPVSLKTKFQL